MKQKETFLKKPQALISPTLLVLAGLAGIGGSYMGVRALASPEYNMEISLQSAEISLDATPSLATYGQTISLGATISANCRNSGSVRFFDGSIDEVNLLGTTPVVGGGAALSTASLSPGTHQIKALYLGSSTCLSATSSSYPVTISKPTKVSRATNTSLASTRSATTINTPANLITNVSGACGPTGKVSIYNGVVKPENLVGESAYINGRAIFSTSSLKPGVHKLISVYAGDTTCDKSTSPILSITVTE